METKLNINVIEDGSIPLSKLSEIPSGESSVFEAVFGRQLTQKYYRLSRKVSIAYAYEIA